MMWYNLLLGVRFFFAMCLHISGMPHGTPGSDIQMI